MADDPIHDGWAPPVQRLADPMRPTGATNINVGGRRVAGPVQGFGKLWKKTYRVPVGEAVEPAEVVATWRRDFGSFWPDGNRFYAPLTGLEPGEVALLSMTMPGGLELSTGVMVLYADEEGFTLMTPEGHQFAGWITFSAFADPDGRHDRPGRGPHALERPHLRDRHGPLRASHRGPVLGRDAHRPRRAASASPIRWWTPDTECMDKKRQWKRAGNVRHNAAVRSGMHRARRLGRRG